VEDVEELELVEVEVEDAYVPLVVVVAVEEAVDGRIAAAVETGELDFLVKVGV
tara:strand:- start:61 stop:219 length:159 start_codon:yes stop_codon:yes gene_type:complete